MSTEDRLRAALSDRAGRARTSPDALASVFGRAARHRRTVRLTAAAGAVAMAVAGTAFATTLRSGPDAIDPVTPTPSAVPTTAPSPPPPTPGPPAYPADAVLVAYADRRLAIVSTTTGDEIATVGSVETLPDGFTVDWSPDRQRIYWDDGACHVMEQVLATGAMRRVTDGRRPAAGPLGQVAAVGCDGKTMVVVDSAAEGGETRYAQREATEYWEPYSTITSVAWVDGLTLVAARTYEDGEALLLVDRTDREPLRESVPLRDWAHLATDSDGSIVAVQHCCYVDEQGPPATTFVRLDGIDAERGTRYERRELFTVAGRVSPVAALGDAVLYVTDEGLWRWTSGEPTLIRRDVVAVGA